MQRIAAALVLSAATLPLSGARANPWTQATPADSVALNVPADLALTGGGLLAFALPELFKESLAPATCRLCDAHLGGVDAAFHDALTGFLVSRTTADTASNIWAFAALPIASVAGAFAATGPHASDGAGARAAVIVVESSLVSAAAVQAVKFFAARERPFARDGHGDTSGTYSVEDRDSHLGFPSGHTALATSLGVSLATTASLEGSRAAPWLWGAAAAMSVSTGALRMMAEKHYFTDVAAGAAIGAATGVLVPLLHRRGSALGNQVSATAAPASRLSGSTSMVSFAVAM